MSATLALQLAALFVVAWVVPWGLGRLLPEGYRYLVLNGVLSSVALGGGCAFWLAQGYGDAFSAVWQAAPEHFLHLAASSSILWAPIMVVSLSFLPRRWNHEVPQ